MEKLATSKLKFIFILFLPFIILVSNIKSSIYACYNGYDLGIYYQAISHISKWGELNPFVFIRGVKIFNDHFDPVIFIPALLLKVFPHSEMTLIVFEWVMVMSGLLILFKISPRKDFPYFIFWSLIFFLSRGFLTAITYPIHASTWSLPFWILLAYYILKPNTLKLALVCSCLIFFKESYPVTLLLSAPFFFLLKRKKEGQIILLLGLIGILFAFVLRPYFLGSVVGYGNVIFQHFSAAPIGFLTSAFLDQNWGTILKTFGPLLLLLIFMIKECRDSATRKSIYLINIILWPLFALQFAAQNFQFQYSFPFYAMILTIALINGFLPATKNKKIILLIAFLIPSFKYYEQAISFTFFNKVRNCSLSEARLIDIKKSIEIVGKENQDLNIISTGGILQKLIPYHKKLYQFASHGDNLLNYQMAIIEKNESGDVYPMNPDKVENLINQLKMQKIEIKYESEKLIIFKGDISRDKLNLNYIL